MSMNNGGMGSSSNVFGGVSNGGGFADGGFGGFQTGAPSSGMNAAAGGGQYYGGLVDLSSKGQPKQTGKLEEVFLVQ